MPENPLAPPNPRLPTVDGPDGEEIRHATVGEALCLRCEGTVPLEAETHQWVEEGERLVHDGYGPGVGECCGLLYLEQPDGRIDVYEAPT